MQNVLSRASNLNVKLWRVLFIFKGKWGLLFFIDFYYPPLQVQLLLVVFINSHLVWPLLMVTQGSCYQCVFTFKSHIRVKLSMLWNGCPAAAALSWLSPVPWIPSQTQPYLHSEHSSHHPAPALCFIITGPLCARAQNIPASIESSAYGILLLPGQPAGQVHLQEQSLKNILLHFLY